jgi:hypothetical protein
MLLKKRKNAIHGLNITQENFDELCDTIQEDVQRRWLQQETAALQEENSFKIYDVDIEKGLSPIASISFFTSLIIVCQSF